MLQKPVTLLVLLACLFIISDCSFQQFKLSRNKTKNTDHRYGAYNWAYQESKANWKTAAIIFFGICILGAICYGSNCFFVTKMIFCERTEKNYTRMDLTSQV